MKTFERCQDHFELCCLSGLISVVSTAAAWFILQVHDLTAAPMGLSFFSFLQNAHFPKIALHHEDLQEKKSKQKSLN